jgi:cysteine sulfinate desulfinase/cysteine desulfurase-like protein
MGISDEDAYASIRFSFGKYNTQEEVEEVVKDD